MEHDYYDKLTCWKTCMLGHACLENKRPLERQCIRNIKKDFGRGTEILQRQLGKTDIRRIVIVTEKRRKVAEILFGGDILRPRTKREKNKMLSTY